MKLIELFKSFSVPVKVAIISGATLIGMLFMYFTFEAGLWGDLMKMLGDK